MGALAHRIGAHTVANVCSSISRLARGWHGRISRGVLRPTVEQTWAQAVYFRAQA